MNKYPAYISKHNLNHEKHSFRRMTLSCSKLSVLLRRIPSKHNGDVYCLNCLHSFRTKSKLESKILEFNQY